MFKVLNFKRLMSGFSLERAESELGDFRVWFSEETWWWGLNDDGHSYGSEETLEAAKEACQNHYESVIMKADLERFCRTVVAIVEGKERCEWFAAYNGLCSNAVFYDDAHGTHVFQALRKLFINHYPFNKSSDDYEKEAFANETYNNEKRLAFLREHGRVD